jgi:hypothetical protein
LNFRRSPTPAAELVGSAEPGTQLSVVCQVTGAEVEGTRAWNKLVDGSYVSDAYVGAGAPKPLPVCSYPVQVVTPDGELPLGALAWITCTDTSGAYAKLPDGRLVARADLAVFTASPSTC